MTVRTNEYEKSIMYSVQVACLERLKADGLMGDEEKEYLLKNLKPNSECSQMWTS